tara:strand:+ start:913 stop:1449 length:537 start_codon:yes stop_codon:yes gene_type:complete
MSKKSLLNESQVRQFMKLAKLEPLSPGFVEGLKENYGGPCADADPYDELDEAVDEEDDMEMDVDTDEMEDVAGDEEADLEMDAELEAPVDAAAGGKMIAVDDFLAALETALESAMGEEVEIESDDLDDEPVDDEPAELEAPVDDELVDDEMEADDALMEAVTKRVAKRILMEALSTKK